MTLRRLLAVAALFVAPAASAADGAPQAASGEQSASTDTPRTANPRKPERKAQAPSARSRIVDAPGAALLLIPAFYLVDRR